MNAVSDRRRFRLGPGLLVTAAFIGPGTVVTASKAGTQFGCELLWTILFACLGTIVLQSLAAQLGITTGNGLGESIRQTFSGSRLLRPAVAIVIAAIGVGNAAYQTGNLTGAVAGITSITGGRPTVWLLVLSALTTIIILLGRYQILHRVLVGLVVLLSLAFLTTAFVAMPPATRIIRGLLVPSVNSDSLSLVVGLIGTTIVPYNLFLHASGAAATWRTTDRDRAISESRWDTVFSISLGGVVTAAILIAASSAFFDTQTTWSGTDQIAAGLRPTLGNASGTAFAVGLFAAGLTSSITAPVATAYALCGCLGWQTEPSSGRFRVIALTVVGLGALMALFLGGSPASTILFAQIANGLLLPVIAAFLLLVVQRGETRKGNRSGLFLAWLVVVLVGALGLWRVITGLAST